MPHGSLHEPWAVYLAQAGFKSPFVHRWRLFRIVYQLCQVRDTRPAYMGGLPRIKIIVRVGDGTLVWIKRRRCVESCISGRIFFKAWLTRGRSSERNPSLWGINSHLDVKAFVSERKSTFCNLKTCMQFPLKDQQDRPQQNDIAGLHLRYALRILLYGPLACSERDN